MKWIRTYFKTEDLPTWLLVIAMLVSSTILLWPFIFFMSIFMFDAPGSLFPRILYFVVINLYPLILIGNCYLGFHCYRKSKLFGLLVLLLPLIFYLFVLDYFFSQ